MLLMLHKQKIENVKFKEEITNIDFTMNLFKLKYRQFLNL